MSRVNQVARVGLVEIEEPSFVHTRLPCPRDSEWSYWSARRGPQARDLTGNYETVGGI